MSILDQLVQRCYTTIRGIEQEQRALISDFDSRFKVGIPMHLMGGNKQELFKLQMQLENEIKFLNSVIQRANFQLSPLQVSQLDHQVFNIEQAAFQRRMRRAEDEGIYRREEKSRCVIQ